MLPIVAGLIAGAAATVPMSLFMEGARRQSPRERQRPLPPEEITGETSRRAGVAHRLGRQELAVATLVAHFGYGSAAGALFAPLAARLDRAPVLDGVACGLLLWAASYLGWLPAAGLVPPATRDSGSRAALMIAAHVVWGATLGALVHGLRADHRR